MKLDRRLLSRPGFQSFIFGLGLVLVHWPFLVWPMGWRQPHAYLYLFLVWTLLVLVMFLISRSLGPHLPGAHKREEGEESPPEGA